MEKTREQILLSDEDIAHQVLKGDSPEWERIERKTTGNSCRKERGCVQWDVILKRVDDGKFFKGSYKSWSSGAEEFDRELEEVFVKDKTCTTYE